ncbi:hypothetical protein ABB02_00490 [Clostridiaceae bacterium JG1575]|nr:hypothetical protein ABB02_00490 [Clostridiaceae bacterium JG1575]
MFGRTNHRHLVKSLLAVTLITGTFVAQSFAHTAPVQAAPAKTVDHLNIRNKPSMSGDILTCFRPGTVVDVLSYGKGWSKISYQSKTAYMATEFLSFTGKTTTKVNALLRQSPSYQSAYYGLMKQGTPVTLLGGPTAKWHQVRWNGFVGYVHHDLLNLPKAVVPNPQPPKEPYALKKSTPFYMNAQNAKDGKNSVGTFSPGPYFVYKRYNGMVNITKKAGSAGAWINPKAPAVPENPKPAPQDPYPGYTKMTFRVSFYSTLAIDNGGWTTTAMGTKLRYGVLASNFWPLRSQVVLPGWGNFVIEDRGGSDFDSKYRLDLCIPRNAGESDYQYRSRVWSMGLKDLSGYIKAYRR